MAVVSHLPAPPAAEAASGTSRARLRLALLLTIACLDRRRPRHPVGWLDMTWRAGVLPERRAGAGRSHRPPGPPQGSARGRGGARRPRGADDPGPEGSGHPPPLIRVAASPLVPGYPATGEVARVASSRRGSPSSRGSRPPVSRSPRAGTRAAAASPEPSTRLPPPWPRLLDGGGAGWRAPRRSRSGVAGTLATVRRTVGERAPARPDPRDAGSGMRQPERSRRARPRCRPRTC